MSAAHSSGRHVKEERQEIRQGLRMLGEAFQEGREAGTVTATEATEVLGESNKLYASKSGEVKEAREGVLDSHLLRMVAETASELASRIDTGMRSYNPSEYLQRLAALLTDDEGDLQWERMPVAQYMRTLPLPSYLHGPLGKERRVTKPRQRREKEVVGEAVKPLEVTDNEEEKRTETTRRVTRVHETLRDMVDFWEFVLDPLSFTRTVENIFHFSFLLKEGKSQVAVNEQGIPMVSRARGAHGSSQNMHAAQTIVSIDHEIWEGLKKRYPHRTRPLIPPLEEDESEATTARRNFAKRRREDDEERHEYESPAKRARTRIEESVSVSEDSSMAERTRKKKRKE